MDTYSLAAAARVLRTSAPRVRRAIDRLGMRVERADSGVFRLTQSQVDELSRVIGGTSFDPEGLAWGSRNLPASAWEHAAATRGLEPAKRALARNLARNAPDAL